MAREPLTYSDLYPLLPEHVSRDNDRLWKVRAWAIALAGGIHALWIRTLALGEGAGTRELEVALLTVGVGSALNGLFGWLAWRISDGTFVLGAYMEWLEKRANLVGGWEHFVKYLGTQRPPRFPHLGNLIAEPILWLALSYVGALIFIGTKGLHGLLAEWYVALAIAGAVCLFVSVLRVKHEPRRKARRDAVDAFVATFEDSH